jgi:hypothetical protein
MSPSKPIEHVESIDGRLRIEFHWIDDRYQQRVRLDGVEVGFSLEGDANQPWPPSPPIQQLSIETIDGRPTALAVGGAGRGHWSLSGTPELGQPSAIRFELACRCGESTAFLGSTYRLAEALVVEPTDGEVDVGEAEAEPGQPIHRRVVIRPITSITTSRWSYRIEPIETP